MSLLCVSALIVYLKRKYKANKVYNLKKKQQQQTNMIISNPMYDKETKLENYESDTDLNSVTDNSVYEDEYNNYDDVEYNDNDDSVYMSE